MKVFFVVIVVFFLSWGYNNLTKISISDLNKMPTKYDGTQITVSGRVTDNISLLQYGGYLISDGESKILIITNQGTPKNGTSIEVTGVFRKALSLNDFEYNFITTL